MWLASPGTARVARTAPAAPAWLRDGTVLLQIDSYLRSGIRFVYVVVSMTDSADVQV